MFSLKKKDTPEFQHTTQSAQAPAMPFPQQAHRPVAMSMPQPQHAPTTSMAPSVTSNPFAPPVASHNPYVPSATAALPEMPQAVTQPTTTQSASIQPTPAKAPDYSKYAPSPEQRQAAAAQKPTESIVSAEVSSEKEYEPHVETRPNGDKVFKAKSVSDVPFADCWYTPEGVIYIRDKSTKFALIPFEPEDADEFYRALEQGYTGSSSFAIQYLGESYRVERVITTTGVQYNCRKMPTSTPNLYKLGIPDPITKYLASLAPEAGLILFGGPTGMGKTTTASALMKEFLEEHGGFLYTIEDPPEMPLDGLYHARNGALGLCKQSPVENEHWEDGLKSALRSKPRYILVGEIRSPEVASQTLRAATSGHLVLSTIHATSVEDALNSIIKYAMGAGLDQELVADLLARGILAVVHQKLEGTTTLHPVVQTVFANPNPLMPDQLRNAIREGRISLGTLMEAQQTRMFKGMPMFKEMK